MTKKVMGNKLNFFIFTLIFSLRVYSADPAFAPVELQWDEIPGASEYILEVQTNKGIVVKTIKSKTPSFNFKMQIGLYKVRGQVASASGRLSPWSELIDITVNLPPPKIDDKKNNLEKNQLTPDAQSMKAHTEIEWDPVPNADHYQIDVMNKEGKTIEQQVVKTVKASFDLPVGEYKYKIQTISADGISSDPVVSKNPIVVKSAQVSKPKFENEPGQPPKWKASSQSKVIGNLEYAPHLSEEWELVQKNIEMTSTTFSLKDLKPGRYRLRLLARAPGWIDSENVTSEFVIKPTEKDLKFDSK